MRSLFLLFSCGLLWGQNLELQEKAIFISEKDIQLPAGHLHIQNGLFVPISLIWGDMPALVVGYLQLEGETQARIDFKNDAEARVAHYNYEGVQLVKRPGLNAVDEHDHLRSLTTKGKGLLFSSIALFGEDRSLSESQLKSANKELKEFIESRASIYIPTQLCLDPVVAAYAATANGQNYLQWFQIGFGNPYIYFFDGFRTLQQGVIVLNELDGIYKEETHFTVSLLPDLNQPRYPNLSVTSLQGNISSSNNKQIDFDLNVGYVDPFGGNRVLYLDLFSSRIALREKNKHGDQHQLNYGSITETRIGQSGNPEQEVFSALTAQDLVQYKHDQPDHMNQITSIQAASGKSLSFFFENDALIVDLESATVKDQPFQLHFQYGGDLLAQDFGMEMVEFSNYAWFPRGLAHLARPTFDVTIRVQDPWIAIGPGSMKRESEGKANFVQIKEDHPVSHPNIFFGKYHEFSYKLDGKTANYFSYAQNRKSAVGKLNQLVGQFLGFYNQILGVVPYESFSIVETKEFMQPTTQTSGILAVTSETFERFSPSQRAKQAADTNTYLGINETIAIGLASLWWSGQVQPATEYEEWFNYGFPEYCAYMLMKLSKKPDAEDKFLKRWQARADYVKHLPLALAEHVVDHHKTNVQWDLKRAKSAMMLDKLHTRMGDQAFFNLLNGFLRITNFKTPITINFFQATGSITKSDETQFYLDEIWGYEK